MRHQVDVQSIETKLNTTWFDFVVFLRVSICIFLRILFLKYEKKKLGQLEIHIAAFLLTLGFKDQVSALRLGNRVSSKSE